MFLSIHNTDFKIPLPLIGMVFLDLKLATGQFEHLSMHMIWKSDVNHVR